MRFASTATRDAALASVKTVGMKAHLHDSRMDTTYTGTGTTWSSVGPTHGAEKSVTLTVTQGATPTFTTNYAAYVRVGRRLMGSATLTFTSAGTAANAIVVTGLPTAANGIAAIGSGWFKDASLNAGAGGIIPVLASLLTLTQIQFLSPALAGSPVADVTIGSGATSGFTAAIASGDVLSFEFNYPAADDA